MPLSAARGAAAPWGAPLHGSRCKPLGACCRPAFHFTPSHFATCLPLPAPADSGKCLYVSGIPGTGKTATVLEVMRSMKRRRWVGGWVGAAGESGVCN